MEKLRGRRRSFVPKLVTALSALVLVAVAPGIGHAYVLGAVSNSADKVLICHVNSSGDPYDVIEVSANGWKDATGIAHDGHDGDFLFTEGDAEDEALCPFDDPAVEKVTICHVTGNETYETIEVAGAAWVDREGTGHAAHSAGEPPHEDFELAGSGLTDCPFDDPKNEKVTICHATESPDNPYVEIEVAGASWFDRNGVAHGHGAHEDDFVLAEGEECPGPAEEDPECDDGLDNDEGGLTDLADPGCSGPEDNDETSQCQDGLDNDGDTRTDHPADPGCTSPEDNSELGTTQCDDGIDNDGDGDGADFPDDPDCESPEDDDESDPVTTSGGGGGSRRASPTPAAEPTPEPSVSAPAALPARPMRCGDLARKLGLRLVTGTQGRDVLRGTRRSEVFCGKGGKDRVMARGGHDIIWLGRGNDFVRAGKGDDRIRGQRGDDIIFGDRGNDLVTGGAGNDSIEGGRGNDRLYGQEAADGIFGGPDNDAVYGGPGQDTCTGGGGDDNLGKGCETILP